MVMLTSPIVGDVHSPTLHVYTTLHYTIIVRKQNFLFDNAAILYSSPNPVAEIFKKFTNKQNNLIFVENEHTSFKY